MPELYKIGFQACLFINLSRAGLRKMGALGKQQELGPRFKQTRTGTPAAPWANIVFVEHVAISDWLAVGGPFW